MVSQKLSLGVLRTLAAGGIFTLTAALQANEMQALDFKSSAIAQEVKINVLLPDGYQENPEQRYPVVYLLHGVGGDYTEWARVGVADETKGLNLIIVMPEGDQSFYVNHHNNPEGRWEDYLTQEVIPFIDAKFRTRASAQARGISGLSMGGYGALVLGLRHPELFSSIASHSGALSVPRLKRGGRLDAVIDRIYGPEDSQERQVYDLLKLAQGLDPQKYPDIYIDCGSGDFLLEANREFVAELSKMKAKYEYREVPGGHDFPYWKRNIRYSLSHQLAVLERPEESPAESPASLELAGIWDASSTLPSGEVRPSTLTIRKEGESWTAHSAWDGGEVTLDTVQFNGGRLKLEKSIERDGQKGLIRVEASLKDRKFIGRWQVLDESGQEVLGGVWNAVARTLAEKSAAGKGAEGAEPAHAAILGDWSLLVDLQGNQLDYGLKFSETNKILGAVLISPRSGEHKFHKVGFKDGKLSMEIEREIEGNAVQWIYDAQLKDGELKGTLVPQGFEDFKGTFIARRKKSTEEL